MAFSWIVKDNHIALEDGDKLLHPSAQEIYTIIASNNTPNDPTKFPNPNKELPNIRFSRLGTPVFLRLRSTDSGVIILDVFAKRKNKEVPVDVISGNVINHCVSENVWFFLSGNVNEVQDLLNLAQIKSNGKISMRQYLKLVEYNSIHQCDCLIDETCLESLKLISPEPGSAPSNLKATLFPYQSIGYNWLRQMLIDCNGCLLGDEMGLGKTMQVIAVMLHLKSISKTPMLVIAPISLLMNWKRECAKFAPSLYTHVHYGKGRISFYRDFLKYDVVITSYTTVASDLSMLKMVNWELVALDEAQNIKNPYSARAKSCKALKRERSLAVTGTPFENHVTDIWSLLDFAQPGLLGSVQSYKASITDDEEGGKRIEPILSPLMIRRLVSDVAKDLPEKVVTTQAILMSEQECDEYNRFRASINTAANEDTVNMGMLQQLRMYCTHPDILNNIKASDDPTLNSVKYQRACEILEEVFERNEKALIFTSYKKMFDIFKKDIPNRFGVQLWCINGETPVEERQKIVDRFNNLDAPAVLILNPRAAGTGLNITGANHVIHYNLEWNPSLEDQSSARAYRRGQKRTVFIYRLYYADTIEQVVNERIERKRDIASSAIVGNTGKSQDRMDIIRALQLAPSISQHN